MATVDSSRPLRPYKFLDFYGEADRAIFFGRRREVETLLADVVATRLVVLFAKTGTGKSSLINAGVRPRLSSLNYDTVFVRLAVDRPPAEAARQALYATGLFRSGAADTRFADELAEVVRSRKRPLVLFFDQFEEFFLFTLRGGDKERTAGTEFIQAAGEIYRSKDSGVHMVFSMREDYLAEMDAFRDEIPTIFHNDSQLRLRAFDDQQAMEAIEGPADKVEVPFRFEKGLTNRILQDLPRDDGGISLVALQIVCDTLWRSMKDNIITVAQYEDLGRTTGVLAERFEQDLAALGDTPLGLLTRMMPLLRTADDTKQMRTIPELATLLKLEPADLGDLENLVEQLKRMHLLREGPPDRSQHVEWVSDYLSALSHQLEVRIQRIGLRRAASAHRRSRASKDPGAAAVTREHLIDILTFNGLLDSLSLDDWRFLLELSLIYGDIPMLWFTKAATRNHPVWDTMRGVLNDRSTPLEVAERLVRFIGELRTPESMKLLDSVRDRAELAVSTNIAQESVSESDRGSRGARVDEIVKETRLTARGHAGLSFTGHSALTEADWSNLLDAIRLGRCVPFVGADLQSGYLPAPTEVAREWARQFNYPFSTASLDLARVAQYVSVTHDRRFVKEEITALARRVETQEMPDTARVYNRLAELPLPVFVATDFTDSLKQALKGFRKSPLVEVCPWNPTAADRRRPQRLATRPTVAQPLVYHLFGHVEDPESIVLTEEDILDFLFNVSRDEELIPTQVRAAVAQGTAIFLGYRVDDWSFQVLLRSQSAYLERSMRRGHIAVQVPVDEVEGKGAADYLERYYRSKNIRVFWGTVEAFVYELTQRWHRAMGPA